MKRWPYFVLAAALGAAAAYVYMQGGLGSLLPSSGRAAAGTLAASHWHTINRPGQGFQVDLPGEDKNAQVPAYNETGRTEAVHMLVSDLDGDITYALTWEDNPPVARVSHSVGSTLNAARDGMLARTNATIIRESRDAHRSYPSLQVLARNNVGGLLDARLVMVNTRLYVLMALFPSAGARRETDVNRFFDSFVPTRASTIPESMPASTE